MAFTDPQSVTISGTTISLPRVSTRDNESKYLSGDGFVNLSISSAYGRRTRRVVRLDHAKISPDAFNPAISVRQSMSVYYVIDTPSGGLGYTNAEALAVSKGLTPWLTDANLTKVLGGES